METSRAENTPVLALRCEASPVLTSLQLLCSCIVFPVWHYHRPKEGISLLPLQHTCPSIPSRSHTHVRARARAHTHTLAESTLHLLYGCGSCCASKARRGVDIMTASANMRARLTRSQFENWLKAVGDEVSCARPRTRLWQRVMNSLCQSFSACICLDAGRLDSLGGSRSFQSDLLFI